MEALVAVNNANIGMTVLPCMKQGGNMAPLATQATGGNWSTFPSQPCSQLIISNNTGVTIVFAQDGVTANPVPVFTGTYFPIYGLANANEISVQRADQSNTQVNVNARWEG